MLTPTNAASSSYPPILLDNQHESIISGCNNVLKRMDPNCAKKCVDALSELLLSSTAVDTTNKFLSQPHVHGVKCIDFEGIQTDDEKMFICCEFNRHSQNRKSYRSPWSNAYFEDTLKVADETESTRRTSNGWLRELEIQANELWETYAHLYYGTSTGNSRLATSVYLLEEDATTSSILFKGCFAIQKQVTIMDSSSKNEKLVTWKSLHQVQVTKEKNTNGKKQSSSYLVNSTVDIAVMDVAHPSSASHNTDNNSNLKNVTLKGQFNRQMEKQQQQQQEQQQQQQLAHLTQLGHMIEQIESDIRTNMNSLSIQVTKDILDSLLTSSTTTSSAKDTMQHQQNHAAMLSQAILLRKTRQQN